MMSAKPRGYQIPPDIVLDLEKGVVVKQGADIGLRPKSYETLVHLLANHDRLVSKSELMETIWADTAVTDDVLVQSIAEIRRALGDKARDPRYVRTVPKRGYIFFAKVDILNDESESIRPAEVSMSAATRQTAGRSERWPRMGAGWTRLARLSILFLALALLAASWSWLTLSSQAPSDDPVARERVTVAVFPFEVKSDRQDNQWFSAGIAELIGRGLLSSPGLEVLGRGQLSGVGGEDLDTSSTRSQRDLAHKLRADRMVTGTFFQLGQRIQIHASLSDVETGEVAFSQRWVIESSESIFSAVDQICLRILHQLAVERGLQTPQSIDIQGLTSDSLEAHRYYLNGLEHFRAGGSEGFQQARSALEKAIAIDPAFSLAHFKKAQVEQWAEMLGYSRADIGPTLKQATQHAASLSRPEQLMIQGLSALWIDQQPISALKIWRSLCRDFPIFAAEAGVPSMILRVLVTQGRFEEACQFGDDYIDNIYMSGDDLARLLSYLARAYRSRGDVETAISLGERCLRHLPDERGRVYWYHRLALGRYYLDAGRRKEALAIFGQATRDLASDTRLLTDVAWGYYMAGRKDTAVRYASAALQEDPLFGNAYHLLGWIQLSRGQFDQAAENLQQAYEKTPAQFGWNANGIIQVDLAALYYSGVALDKAGQRQKAEETFRTLVERCREIRSAGNKHNRPTLEQAQTHTYEALAHCRLGDKAACRQARLRVPSDVTHFHELSQHMARIAAVEGRPEEALDWLQRAIDAGAREYQHLWDNPDFETLRSTDRFQALIVPWRPQGAKP